MRPAAAITIRTLIEAIPDNRLRELFLELALAALVIPSVEQPKGPARNGGRRNARAGGRQSKRKAQAKRRVAHHGRDYLDTFNAQRREQRRLAREARIAAGEAPKRRGRKPKNNGAAPHGNDTTTSAAALWEHARKLEPRQPWRAVARELGVSDGAAQFAHRNQALPPNVSPAAAARFLTV